MQDAAFAPTARLKRTVMRLGNRTLTRNYNVIALPRWMVYDSAGIRAKRLKRQVTIRLDQATITYFKTLAEDAGIPYQTLINPYLRDCASSR